MQLRLLKCSILAQLFDELKVLKRKYKISVDHGVDDSYIFGLNGEKFVFQTIFRLNVKENGYF